MNAETRTEMRCISLVLPSPWTVAVILGLSVIFWAGTAVGQGGPEQANPGQLNPGQIVSGQAVPGHAVPVQVAPEQAFSGQTDPHGEIAWRIRILEAVVVAGPNVTLGEIAEPVGNMPPETWQSLAGRELWPSPAENGRPMNMARHKLKDQLRRALGPELEALCIIPGAMVIQRGGRVVPEAELQQILVKTLTPEMSALPGEASLSGVRLPPYIFLGHSGQTVSIESVNKLAPGRVPLRISVLDLDKSVARRITGSAFLDVWVTVPAAKEPVNRGDVLTPDKIMFVRKNLAYVRGELWDGIGGPHRLKRAVGAEQVIYLSDLDQVPLITKGAQVTLVYERGVVRLEVPAQAMADGASGQLLSVRNLQSKSVVKATVHDSRTVMVN